MGENKELRSIEGTGTKCIEKKVIDRF